MPDATDLLLCLCAFLAGVVNSVAGGGTLLTFPALLAILPPVTANGTSTVALLPGSLAASWGYRQELREVSRMALWLLVPSLVGGYVGTKLVTTYPDEVFKALVPWLILFAATLFLVQGPVARRLRKEKHDEPARGWTLAAIVVFQFFVAVYGGYFGAGIGILMLSSLTFMGIGDVHRVNALKTLLAGAINATSVAVFIDEGRVEWRYAGMMAAAAVVGGYAGARVARRLPAAYVRAIVIAVGFGLAGYEFYKQLR
jgi:uncharacterized membrane protein YfcA